MSGTDRYANSSRSVTMSTGSTRARAWRSCAPRNAVLTGVSTAPSQAAPNQSSMNSMLFDRYATMRSPAFTPAAASLPALHAAMSGASA